METVIEWLQPHHSPPPVNVPLLLLSSGQDQTLVGFYDGKGFRYIEGQVTERTANVLQIGRVITHWAHLPKVNRPTIHLVGGVARAKFSNA